MKRPKYQPCKFCKREIQKNQRKCPFCKKYLYDYLEEITDLDRNNDIKRKRNAGATLRKLSIEYGLSQERIRQIVG